MATRFVPITVQLSLGNAKAQVAQLRGDLNNLGKQTEGVTSGLKSTLGGVKDSLSAGSGNFLKNLLPDAANLTNQVGGLASSVGGFASVAGLAAGAAVGLGVALGGVVLNAAKAASEMKLTAEVTGLNTQQLQFYEAAAKVTGAGLSTLTEGVLEYRDRAKDALAGNLELTQSFQRFGLEVKEAVTNPAKSFDAFLDQLQKIPDSLTRVRRAQEVLGNGNRELLRTVIALTDNQGELRKRIEQTGVALDQQAVNQLAQINREYELAALRVENAGKKTVVAGVGLAEFISKWSTFGVIGRTAANVADYFSSEQSALAQNTNAATGALQNQIGALEGVRGALASLQIANVNKSVENEIAKIAVYAKDSKEAVATFKLALSGADSPLAKVVADRKRFAESIKEINKLIDPPAPKIGGGRAGGVLKKEKSEFDLLTESLNKLNKEIVSLQSVGSREFALRFEVDDAAAFKNQLQEILKLRRQLGLKVDAPLPSNAAGAASALGDIGAFKQSLGQLDNKRIASFVDDLQKDKEAGTAFASLQEIIQNALPRTTELTVAQTVAQSKYYENLLKLNPALAELKRREAEAADATIAHHKAQQTFLSLQEQLNSELEQFQNFTREEKAIRDLQKRGITDLTSAEAQRTLGLARQIDQQNAFKQQIDESRQRTEAFANTLRGLFDELFERGPKAFFDRLLQTLKRTLAQMLSDMLTSQALKLLGLVPGGQGAGGFGGAQQSGGGVGGFLQSFLGGSGGGGNFLTGGFAGGNPAGQVLSQGQSGGGVGGFLNNFNLSNLLNRGGSTQVLNNFPLLAGGGGDPAFAGGLQIPQAGPGLAASLGATGLLSGGFLGGSLLGGNSQVGRLLGGVGGSLGAGFLGASGLFGSGIAGALPALFSNPITAIIGGALIGGALLARFLGNRDLKRLSQTIKEIHQVKVPTKGEGLNLLNQIKEIGVQRYGKKRWEDNRVALVKLDPVEDLIFNYAEATNQAAPGLRRQRELLDPNSPLNNEVQNQIIPRATGGSLLAGQLALVGERRPEVFVPGSNGFVFPSVATFEQRLLEALQRQVALGGIFSGIRGALLKRLQANVEIAQTGAAGAAGGNSDLMRVLIEEVRSLRGATTNMARAAASIQGISPEQMLTRVGRRRPDIFADPVLAAFNQRTPQSDGIRREVGNR
ncbi:MAG: hypothetical protein AB7U82_33585 [Blastocatellales bacterium]